MEFGLLLLYLLPIFDDRVANSLHSHKHAGEKIYLHVDVVTLLGGIWCLYLFNHDSLSLLLLLLLIHCLLNCRVYLKLYKLSVLTFIFVAIYYAIYFNHLLGRV